MIAGRSETSVTDLCHMEESEVRTGGAQGRVSGNDIHITRHRRHGDLTHVTGPRDIGATVDVAIPAAVPDQGEIATIVVVLDIIQRMRNFGAGDDLNGTGDRSGDVAGESTGLVRGEAYLGQ